ncbi:hypothetical protein GUITHDRAFT_144400 [Guillardia theta CCMP2712]|uniref:Uncharacterized protein n=1 Tax=Guillardia theta (strain CCMP2712) TaxID=905079 RepID=L1IPX7_GUITC|nr:hypothetical protein GUITHDRAFT_144400 [Guillardia theta CCMP2712]EKX38293.1 hypothetical protein GUITHDRAFT_144400 [Guillardia theta CCMP2712]|eukprot:XP_005825273.1 hypothetical protein GUITHDRAFT_144400 [Guillardia theta CCMP2712]
MNEHCPAQPHPEAERRAVLDGNPGWQHSESMQRLLCVGVGLICASMVFSTLMVWRTLFELSWGPFKASLLSLEGSSIPLASVSITLAVASIVDAALAARWTRPGSKEHITPLTPRLCAILVIGFLLAGAISVPPLCRAALKDMMNSDSMIIGGVGSPQGLSPNLLWKRAGQNESAELNLSSLSSSNSSCLSEEK